MQVQYRPLRRSCCNSPFPNPYFRGRVVTNVVSTCDPTPLYYMQLNIIKKKKKKKKKKKRRRKNSLFKVDKTQYEFEYLRNFAMYQMMYIILISESFKWCQ